MSGFSKHPPAYNVGDKVNEFTVTYYCGHTNISPEGQEMASKHHWYECECSCGEVVILNQKCLSRRQKCDECMAADKYELLRAKAPKVVLPEGVPDFARMRFSGPT